MNYKEFYHWYKDNNICVRCRHARAEPNRVMCWKCIEKEKEYDRNKREKNKEECKKRDNKKYKRLKEQGICTYCKHEKAEKGKTKCKKCLAIIRNRRNSKKNGIDRSERVSYGLCYTCGKNKLMEGKRVCEICYQKRIDSISKIMYMPVNETWKEKNNLIFKR